MNIFKSLILTLLFKVFATAAYCQADTLVFKPINSSVLQQYDIRRVTVAKDGKLWLTTGNGLISYDGNETHLYTHIDGDTTSLSGHNLSRSFMDEKGNLFVVQTGEQQNINGQIDYFNTVTGKSERLKIKVQREDSSKYNFAFPFTDILTRKDEIWCARENMGFIQYNLKNRTTRAYSLLSVTNKKYNSVNAIREDINDENILWLATNNGIYSFNKKNYQLKRNFRCGNIKDTMPGDIDIARLDVKSEDTIWFTSVERGIGCYDIKTGKYTIYPFPRKKDKADDRIVLTILQALNAKEYLLELENHTPCIFNMVTHQYIFKLKISTEFPALHVYNVVADSVGNFWCLIYGKLYEAKQTRDKFNSIAIHDSHYKDLFYNVFKTVIWDEKKEVYYAAFHMSDGVFVFDKKMHLLKSIPGPSYSHPSLGNIECVVIDIGLDKNGLLWLCGDLVSIYDSVAKQLIPVSRVYPGLKSLNQRFRNFVFKNNYLYALPCNPLSTYLYRINVNQFTCDSILLSGINTSDKQSPNQLGPLEMDESGENAYLSNKNIVFQFNLPSGKARKIIELKDSDKVFAHFSNFHWYSIDDDNNLWVSSLDKTWIFEPLNLHVIRTIDRKANTYFLQSYNVKSKGIMSFINSTGFDLYDYKNWKQYQLSINDGLITYLNWSTAVANNMLFLGGNNYMQYIPWSGVMSAAPKRKFFLSDIQVFNKPFPADTLPEYLHSLTLPHNKNYVSFTVSTTEFDQPERLEYRYRLEGVDKNWTYVNYLNRTVSYTNLRPGKYTFYASLKNDDGDWEDNSVKLNIDIIPAWWQTMWFKLLAAALITSVVVIFAFWRIRTVRKQEKLKAKYEKELWELEAKALRAQMNPHFIFNSLNSIKSLINKNENDKAAEYLTTFSKLIRTLFQNSNKREISLHEELETCKLYTQIEKMRFAGKVNFIFEIDESVDLKDIKVPALILQPFIENAIWHGLVPKESGGAVLVSIKEQGKAIECVVDDDGIGRELSKLYKSQYEATHQSKGIGLTRSRLELDKLLNNREDTIHIFDKSDEQGKPVGTTVVITFKENSI
ncbi:MAG: histidine kinase [Chitinophagaceae bacterium]